MSNEEFEETEESYEDCGCDNFANMDILKSMRRNLHLPSLCEDCKCYQECFELTYAESGETKASLKRENDNLEIQKFLSNLPSENHDVDFTFSKPRKLVKVGKLSYGFTIPRILSLIYPKGSKVLSFWSGKSKTLYFYGVGSFVPEGNRDLLAKQFLEGSATFRNVVAFGKISAVILPTQFLENFNADLKLNPQFDNSTCTLFLKSNLTDFQLQTLERKKEEKSHKVFKDLKRTDPKVLTHKDSSEYKQKLLHQRGY